MFASLARLAPLAVLLCLMLAGNGVAQTTGTTDKMTPAGLAPGSPAGSYALSGFDNINLFNGNLNFRLPMVAVGGRGSAGYTITLSLNSKGWHVRRRTVSSDPDSAASYVPEPNTWNGLEVGYGAGVLQGRQTGVETDTCSQTHRSTWKYSITRLTFIGPDGTEYELRDQASDGKPSLIHPCTAAAMYGQSRGKVFVSHDGSAATFISDAEIFDRVEPPPTSSGSYIVTPSGYLWLKDGTRYRVVNSRVTSIRDRNGNTIAVSETLVTDSVGRQVTIERGVTDPTYGVCDRLTYKGFGGAARSILVLRSSLSNILRSGTTQTYSQLFPELNGASSSSVYNPLLISRVILPNNQSYQFKYNKYGEMARVELPTGGAIEYDMTQISGATNLYAYYAEEYQIYRRVTERRVYADGATLTARTTYVENGSVTENVYDGAGSLLTSSVHQFYGNAVQSLFTPDQGTVYSDWKEGKEYLTTTGGLRREEQTWQQPVAVSWYPSGYANGGAEPENDPRITQTVSTLLDTNQVSKQTFAYDQYNNQTDVYEYDFGVGAAGVLVRRTQTQYLTTNTVGGTNYDYACERTTTCGASANIASVIHLRSLPVQQSVYDADGVERARTTYEYDSYAGDTNHASLIDRTGIIGLDSSYTSAYQMRGNVTRTSSWLLQSNQAFSSYAQYDVAGNVVKMIDARGSATTLGYTDSYGAPDGEARANYGAAELGTQTSYALPTSATNALGHTVYAQYDYYLGRVVDGEDVNGITSSGYYNDALDRPTQVVRAVNAPVKAQTTFSYNDSGRIITSTSDQIAYNDNRLKSEIVYDGLGRTTESRQYESANSYIATRQIYDAVGRVSQTSNPYRSGETIAWMTTQYDVLGRATSVTTPDAAVVSTSYSGNSVTATDQAGKDRQSKTDALGRLIQAVEDPGTGGLNYQTTYAYDTLDNLVTITQGSQTRSFAYDSLKRPILVRNPEQTASISDPRASGLWSFKYEYDGNGNLTQKTDARGVVTTYGYDALNRATSRSYSDSTPTVIYSYDAVGVAYSKGKLTSVSSSVSATNYIGFDALGRATANQQVTDGQTYSLGYSYNLAGALTSETYPSGRVVSTAYDNAGRISTVSGQKSGELAKTYASQFAYSSHGAVSALTLGNGLVEQTVFNNRLQPIMIKLSTAAQQSVEEMHYYYGGTDNNGNVLHHTSVIEGEARLQVYEYDELNRLKKASEVSQTSGALNWQQTFTYDRFGNRNFDVAQTTSAVLGSNLVVDQSNNRYAAGQGSILYDAAGNVSRDFNGHIFSYDGENKQTSYDNGQATYSYDGDGRRIRKVAGNVTTIFVYEAGGQLVAEYMTSTPEGSGRTSYFTSDTLSTPRVITDINGQVKSRHDYLPFGDEIPVGVGGRTTGQGYVADDVRQKFTRKERDNETGLDCFGARYYSSAQGRFTSVDPIFTTLERLIDPQRLNLYAYARNNPLKFTDPNGMDLALDTKNLDEAQKKYALVQAGLKKEDRSHTHLALGDGKNGYAKGVFYIKVDSAKDYQSDSKNFKALQSIANDRSSTTIVHFVKTGQEFPGLYGVRNGSKIEARDPKEVLGEDGALKFSPNCPMDGCGATLFPLHGSPQEDQIYSTTKNIEVYVLSDQPEVEVVATIHHELRAHVFLSDMGKHPENASHSKPGVTGEARAAEAEAKENYKNK
jgi:RHS repeat-associated protein